MRHILLKGVAEGLPRNDSSNGPSEITSNIHGLCLFLYLNLGILYQKFLQCHLRIGTQFSCAPNFAIPSRARSSPGTIEEAFEMSAYENEGIRGGWEMAK